MHFLFPLPDRREPGPLSNLRRRRCQPYYSAARVITVFNVLATP
jgi:hypothetical protein